MKRKKWLKNRQPYGKSMQSLHPQYTDKTKRKVAVENKREGFEKSGFINSLSADMIIQEKLIAYVLIMQYKENKHEQSKLSGAGTETVFKIK